MKKKNFFKLLLSKLATKNINSKLLELKSLGSWRQISLLPIFSSLNNFFSISWSKR